MGCVFSFSSLRCFEEGTPHQDKRQHMKLWNCSLNTESKKHREMRLKGLLPKKTYKLATQSKKSASLWAKTRRECIKAYGGKCFLCGGTGIMHVHHWQYTRTQRPDLKYDQNNLCLLCSKCHNHTGADKRFYELQTLIKNKKDKL